MAFPLACCLVEVPLAFAPAKRFRDQQSLARHSARQQEGPSVGVVAGQVAHAGGVPLQPQRQTAPHFSSQQWAVL